MGVLSGVPMIPRLAHKKVLLETTSCLSTKTHGRSHLGQRYHSFPTLNCYSVISDIKYSKLIPVMLLLPVLESRPSSVPRDHV